ncbi:conserved hypothetical protein [Pediculus humanus corporis]|uniref:Protein FRA10AC1 n=1 Tax=Pediculus humanus subsp. corporis TaxID=121224 RepID=E0VV42_PEDHC|nr:uncharacterized protein Phum_PHUM458510 [Pediculus humanus corporis]EEB17248.1 conserved hypothetical protein [Pediculus humanus corporis]
MSYGKRYQNLNPYDLHKILINDYLLSVKGKTSLLKRDTTNDKRDIDVIKENHQFLWNETEDVSTLSWEKKLAKQYYNKLFKEYCVADMSRYKENKIGLRWRTQQELINGKGQFSCGNKKCSDQNDLRTWEVNFGYMENNTKKNALVKLSLYYRDNNFNTNLDAKKFSDFKSTDSKNTTQNNETHINDVNAPSSSGTDSKSSTDENTVWKQTQEPNNEKSREQEFDDYLNYLLL